MSFENPLDHIKKMNAENAAKKQAQQEESEKQEILDQENTDELYETKKESKEALTESVEAFKQRISEITGTQEEMIAQYRETINEAKKDPKTLEYVRNNFDEVFKSGKEQWRETGAEKADHIESMNQNQENADKLSNEMEKLYPETSEGKAELKTREDKINEENLQKLTELIGDRRYNIKDSIKENLSSEEIEDYLQKVKNKNEIPSQESSEIRKKRTQEKQQLLVKENFENLKKDLEETITSYEIELQPLFNKYSLGNILSNSNELEIKGGRDAYITSDNFINRQNEINHINEEKREKIRELEDAIKEKQKKIFKTGLSKLELQKTDLENETNQLSNLYNKIYEYKKNINLLIEKSFSEINSKIDSMPWGIEKVTNIQGANNLQKMFEYIEQPLKFTSEELELETKEKELRSKIQEYEDKLK